MSSRRRQLLVALAASVCLAPVTTRSASAAPTWLSPTKLSAPVQSAEAPQVAVDGGGDAITVWQRLNEGSGTKTIEASGRPAGSGKWQEPVIVSNTKEEASEPQVGIDSHGDAVAVWLSLDASEYKIEAATRPGVSGAWGAPVTLRLLGPLAPPDPRPDLAVDANGDAVAVWRRLQGPETVIESASRSGTGSFQPAEPVTKELGIMHPAEVGIDGAGDAAVVWEEQVGPDILIATSSRPAGGKWQKPFVDLSAPGHNANEPRVAVAANGDAVAVWERFNGEEIVEAAVRSGAGGTWGKAVALTKPELGKGEPAGQQVAIDGQGEAVATWSRTNTEGKAVIEASAGKVATSAWQAPVSISGPGAKAAEEAPEPAVDGKGDVVVVWERFNGTNEIVEAASGQAASGSWQAPVPLSAIGQTAFEQQVALDAQGDAVAAWARFDGKAAYIAEAAGFDAAGPLLNALVVPSAGVAGQALAFSVSPLDVWSALGATSWSFGDGAGQAGTSVTHAYAAPGTYTVTVNSADALGNASATSVSVAIAPAPIPGTTPTVPTAPKITSARLTHTRFRVSKRPTAVSAKAKPPQGTTFEFTLSQPAKLQITFKHSVPGLRSGRRCVAPSAKLRRRHARHCTRTVSVGTLTRAREPAGPDRVAFSGRIGSRALVPGAYRAGLVASANGLGSAPATLSLTVVR